MAVYGKLAEPVGMYDLFYYPLSSGLCALNISLLLSGQRPRGKKIPDLIHKKFLLLYDQILPAQSNG